MGYTVGKAMWICAGRLVSTDQMMMREMSLLRSEMLCVIVSRMVMCRAGGE
jgi:hypothetical protein